MQSRNGVAAELEAFLTTPDVRAIRKTLSQIRPELKQDNIRFRAAVLLLAGPGFRFNIDRMAGRTQTPRALVAACTRRLFDNGVWQPDGALYAWMSPDDPQFWDDVGVAEGRLCRRLDELGRIEWAPAGVWRKAYAFGGDRSPKLFIEYAPVHGVVRAPENEIEQAVTPTERTAPDPDAAVDPAAQLDIANRHLFKPKPALIPAGTQGRNTVKRDLFPDAHWLG